MAEHLVKKAPDSGGIDPDQLLTEQVTDHASFYQVVQWHKECYEYDLNPQHFPWLTMGDVVYEIIRDQDDKFKKKDKLFSLDLKTILFLLKDEKKLKKIFWKILVFFMERWLLVWLDFFYNILVCFYKIYFFSDS